jgi:Ferritin-like domain
VGLHSSSCDGRRRGFGRAAVVLLLAAATTVAVVGCGKSGHGAETDPEKGSDAEGLNAALARELTLLEAYTRAQPALRGPRRPVGRRFRAHEQEYVDALTKGIRGLGGDVEAEPEELDLAEVRGEEDFLQLLYELESAALASYVEAAPRLFAAAPRTLDVSLAAGHAQHLVVLRQTMGVAVPASAPEAFDGGVVPPPASGPGSGPGSGG